MTESRRQQTSVDYSALVDGLPIGSPPSAATAEFRLARDFLLVHREDYDTAYRGFRWPQLETFNYATDWFDYVAVDSPDAVALEVINEDATSTKLSFAELSGLSQRFAGFLAQQGLRRGDRVLLLLGNDPALWVVAGLPPMTPCSCTSPRV